MSQSTALNSVTVSNNHPLFQTPTYLSTHLDHSIFLSQNLIHKKSPIHTITHSPTLSIWNLKIVFFFSKLRIREKYKLIISHTRFQRSSCKNRYFREIKIATSLIYCREQNAKEKSKKKTLSTIVRTSASFGWTLGWVDQVLDRFRWRFCRLNLRF